ncbi:MAG: methylated-DNA--[protein]-cysteine S-methyltransferase [Methylococcales bacterium]|nr:methylated-DNA--[protein]-cysteine S-methyltransferase [Methylococcales bacterium]
MPFVIDWVDTCSGTEAVTKIPTPGGLLVLYSQQGVITSGEWGSAEDFGLPDQDIQRQLMQYCLNGDKPIKIHLKKQGSAYRHKVWAELCKIPFGATMTYSALAKVISSSARAVGNACRDNPYPLIIPCHRVVSVSGFGGYCGQTEGELMAIKHKLLAFEASHKV